MKISFGDSLIDLDTGKLPYVKPLMVGYGLGTKSQFDQSSIAYTYLESTEEVRKYMEEKNAVS